MTDYELDSSTNLPALPEGYFWRVEPNKLRDHPYGTRLDRQSTHNLQLRKKRFLGSGLVYSAYISRVKQFCVLDGGGDLLEQQKAAHGLREEWGRGDVVQDSFYGSISFWVIDVYVDDAAILRTAIEILERRNKRLKRELDEQAEALRLRSFEGDYPPNRVNVR